MVGCAVPKPSLLEVSLPRIWLRLLAKLTLLQQTFTQPGFKLAQLYLHKLWATTSGHRQSTGATPPGHHWCDTIKNTTGHQSTRNTTGTAKQKTQLGHHRDTTKTTKTGGNWLKQKLKLSLLCTHSGNMLYFPNSVQLWDLKLCCMESVCM